MLTIETSQTYKPSNLFHNKFWCFEKINSSRTITFSIENEAKMTLKCNLFLLIFIINNYCILNLYLMKLFTVICKDTKWKLLLTLMKTPLSSSCVHWCHRELCILCYVTSITPHEGHKLIKLSQQDRKESGLSWYSLPLLCTL